MLPITSAHSQSGMMLPTQGSCLAGLTHLGAAFLVLLGFALVLLAYKVVSTHVTTSELGWGRSTYLLLQVVKKNVETIEVEEGTRTRENFEDNVVDNEGNVVTDIEDNGHVIVQGGEDNLAFKAGSDVEDK